MNTPIDIRPLKSDEEFRSFEILQRETWGKDLVEVVSGSLARIVFKIGGIAAGAFDERDQMIGLVFGFTGFSGGHPVHWSHMLAVKREYRDSGVGKSLKLYQREVLLKAGIEQVFWTYDPLVARNAHFNFNLLGTEVTEYVQEMYGTGDDSELFRGIGTDRFIVVWHITSERVKTALSQSESQSGYQGSYSNSPIVVFRQNEHDDSSLPSEVHFERAERVRVEIPPDIQALKRRTIEHAAQWRAMTREAFQFYLKNGYEISLFYRDRSSAHCFYCLRKRG